MPRYSAEQLAGILAGKLVGAGDVAIDNVRSLDSAGEGDVAFLRDAGRKADALKCKAAVLVTPIVLEGYAGTQIVCADPDMAMVTVLEAFAEERFPRPSGISPRASVSPSARLGCGVAIGDHAIIGDRTVLGDEVIIYPHVYIASDCRIGARTVLYAQASVHDRVTVGEDCIIRYSAVIGSDGFGFIQRGGRHVKVPQAGTVRIGNRVEIGSLSTVDRATMDETVIEDGTKIDSHCHVAHNCRIGPDCIMAGGAKLAGSVRLGRGVICAEGSGVSDHITVGDGAILGAAAGVAADVPAGAFVHGMPARPAPEQRRIWALLGRLPQMAEKLRQLEKQLEDLRA